MNSSTRPHDIRPVLAFPALAGMNYPRLEANQLIRVVADPAALLTMPKAHARLIKDEIELARIQIHNRDNKRKSVLTIGVLPSLASSVIPVALSNWSREHPTTRIRIVEKVQVDLLIGLLRGEFDLIVGMTAYRLCGLTAGKTG